MHEREDLLFRDARETPIRLGDSEMKGVGLSIQLSTVFEQRQPSRVQR